MTFMSIQHVGPVRALRRASRLVVAVALASLLWSCESEQTGYQLTLPLIGPMEFDETSCEISGDVCSTDNDCFDEDEFNVGPCTETMEELAAITVPVSLSPSNPSYTLGSSGIFDTAGWTSLFLAQQFSDGEVPEGAQINMTMDGFSLEGGPVTIAVRVFSKIGLIVGRNADYQPVTPSSCTFVLESDATGQDYADGINTCLSDWIAENGAPVDFDMEVTSSEGAAQIALAKSGFNPKQLLSSTVLGTFTIAPGKQCQVDVTQDLLDAVSEAEGFFERLTCGDLAVQGSGRNDQILDLIAGGAAIWDACGSFWSVGAFGAAPLQVGEYTVAVEQSSGVAADVPIVFLRPDDDGELVVDPTGEVFVESLFGAASGKCLRGTQALDSQGRAYAGWIHCGNEPPPARTGYIEVTIPGFCSVAGGSGASGTPGQ